MFRLGTRPDSMRMSAPPVFNTSNFSPEMVEMELGTSLTFSARRSAVTVTACRTPVCGATAVSAGAVWATAKAMGHSSAMPTMSGVGEKRVGPERALFCMGLAFLNSWSGNCRMTQAICAPLSQGVGPALQPYRGTTLASCISWLQSLSCPGPRSTRGMSDRNGLSKPSATAPAARSATRPLSTPTVGLAKVPPM
jgi:hypothetical protein